MTTVIDLTVYFIYKKVLHTQENLNFQYVCVPVLKFIKSSSYTFQGVFVHGIRQDMRRRNKYYIKTRERHSNVTLEGIGKITLYHKNHKVRNIYLLYVYVRNNQQRTKKTLK